MGAIVHLEHHQITLPDEVLDALKLRDGDALDVSIEGNAVRIARRHAEPVADLSDSARARLSRLMRYCGAGRGAYANAAEADAFLHQAREEW